MYLLKLAYKMRSKTLMLGTLLLFIYTIMCTLFFKDIVSWQYIKLFIIVLPVFYTSNVISDEYEYGREGVIFTTKTPIYYQGMSNFLASLLLNLIMITIMFLSAYTAGLEHSLLDVIPLWSYACFLSALAFVASNVTRKSMAGYATAILYWGLFFAAGLKANELLMPFSILININLQYDIIWYNVFSMFSFALLLFLFSIWYLGKGEHIRKKLALISTPITLLILVGFMGIPDTSYLSKTEWQTTSSDEVTMVYQDVPDIMKEELLTIWEATYDELIAISGKDSIYNILQISVDTGKSEDNIMTEEAVTLKLLRQHFNSIPYGGSFFNSEIPDSALYTHFFKNITSYELFKGFSKYMMNTRIDERIYAMGNKTVNEKYYFFDPSESKSSYLQSLKDYATKDSFNRWETKEVSGLLLYTIDQTSPTSLNDFLLALSQTSSPLTLEDIQSLAYEHADPVAIDEAIAIYNKVLSAF